MRGQTMWRTQTGDRVLTDAEWAVFVAGLDWLRGSVEDDVRDGQDDSAVGVAAFDRLTAEQKPGLMADPAEPAPAVTSAEWDDPRPGRSWTP